MQQIASSSAIPSCVLAASGSPRKSEAEQVPRVLWWTALDHLAVLVRTGVQTNSAWGKTTTLVGRKVVLYSLPFEHLSFCSTAPSPHISEVLLIGWPLVVGSYVPMGGSLGWEEDGLEKYKVRWDE